MKFYVYILESLLDRSLYIGQTSDYKLRFKKHNEDLVRSTKNKRPWKLIHLEVYGTRGEAMKREKYLKSLKKPKFIRENIIKKQ